MRFSHDDISEKEAKSTIEYRSYTISLTQLQPLWHPQVLVYIIFTDPGSPARAEFTFYKLPGSIIVL